MSKLGWAGGLGGFSRGIEKGMSIYDMIAQRNRAREAESAFGNVIRDMYGARPPEPMTPDQTSGAPMNAQRPMPTQMAMPGATPMPGGTPGVPMPQGGQGGMPAPGGPPPSWPPGANMPAQQAPMRGGPTAMSPGFETMPQKPQMPQNLTWQAVLGAVAKQFPQGTNPRAMVPVVEKLIPVMNAQSAAEWREMQSKLGGERLEQGDRRLDQTDRRIGQGDERIQMARERSSQTRRMYDARIQQIQTKNAAAAATAKLPPQVKMTFDMHQKVFTQAATTMRSAATNLQRAQWEGSQENIKDARADYIEARQSFDAAKMELESFAASAMPKVKLDLTIDDPADADAAPPQAAPRGAPGATQTLDTGEIVTTTKSGTKAQIGVAPPPGSSGPAALEKPIPNATPRVQAVPGGKAAKPPPASPYAPRRGPPPAAPQNPKSRTPNTLYMTPKGPLLWTGTGWVRQNGAAQRTQ